MEFRAAARNDLGEARAWYRDRGADLARRFVDRVDETLDRIGRSPTTYPQVFRDVRVTLVPDFPYVIYYRDEPQRVLIVAVMHTSRDPETWQARV